MKKGLFITTEGTDGSGKTTQIRLMEEYLMEKGYDTIVTREPGGTSIGEKIRSIILDTQNIEMAGITEMFLYASARAQLVFETIKPAVLQGKIVICDRFVDSSYVYQGFGRGIDLKTVEEVNAVALNGMEPDITFFFDISPEIALERRIASTGADRIEKEAIDFHRRVYNGYKNLAKIYPDRIVTVDSDREIGDIFIDVKNCLDRLISSL